MADELSDAMSGEVRGCYLRVGTRLRFLSSSSCMRVYLRLAARWAGEGFLPTLHDDDELLFKSRVILLFKIPIPKLLHARARARTKRKDLSLTICCLFVCWLVCCVCVVPRRRYCYYGKHAGPRVPPLFYPQSHYSVGGSSGDMYVTRPRY